VLEVTAEEYQVILTVQLSLVSIREESVDLNLPGVSAALEIFRITPVEQVAPSA
jgi:hypothetical protein